QRQGIQKFLGEVPWDHQPMLRTLAAQVGQELGEPDGVIVFDPSAFPKKGTKSVGVAKQWCSRLGKVESCQVGIYMGYVTRTEHAIVDVPLDLPKEWAKDRARRKEAGVPKSITFQTRHQLALEMLAGSGKSLPHTWIAGDDEMGRPSGFRRELRALGQRDLLAVPSNTTVRDIEPPPPAYCGRGPRPKSAFVRVDRWCTALPEDAWTRIQVRDGEKGPLVIEAVKRRVEARTERKGTGPEELLFVTRERQADHTFKLDYYLSNADPDVSLEELARVEKAGHRIEECFERAKGEAGLADYQVRNWIAWHHHQTLSLMAAWFLNQETRRGKNLDPGADVAAAPTADRWADRGPPQRQPPLVTLAPPHPLAGPQRTSQVLSLP
ncbi:MAG: IS701 family transposase, partial [Planctomycetaceae bacterium]|nr:IS701 family transposase [Planctomycetaceae bacterium]